jgi:hypothetical protein
MTTLYSKVVNRLFQVYAAGLLSACLPGPAPMPPPDADAAPVPPPPPPPAPSDAGACTFPTTLCGDACRTMATLNCANDSPHGICCADWLCALPSYAALPAAALRCIAGARTKDALRACGVACGP